MGQWSDKRVLITGGTGMTGANLVRRLVAAGCRPHVTRRRPNHWGRLEELGDAVVPLDADMADTAALARAVDVAQPEVVFHLASTFFNPPTVTPEAHMAVNAAGTVALCQALAGSGARLVYAGSCAVYGDGAALREDGPCDPGSMFGVSKAAAAMAVRCLGRLGGLETVELRLFGPFGPWENARRLIPDTILSALDGREVRIGHGGQQRDFVFMEDVVDAFMLAAHAPVAPGSVFNIGSGVGRAIRDVTARVLELMGNPVPLVTGTMPPRPDEIWVISADISAAQRELEWRPKVEFDDAVLRTIRWFADNRHLAGILT